uniref:Reverse transcriptase Ty1/copia-type domain-containing protein n=1 Tax=Lactuca sativa TaxID=4236 RepID=A0A9R1WRQ1_LACSA|nr:hypothetical protein LSAT_V11C900480970 [Lactuca sativa]
MQTRYPCVRVIWDFTYKHLRTVFDKTEEHLKPNTPRIGSRHIYALHGFVYAFKIWIKETFPNSSIVGFPIPDVGYFFEPGRKIVSYKWIFKKKIDMDGKLQTFKARLVVKGLTQTFRVHYDETFSPVAKIKSITIMLAIAAFYDYEVWQMDVKATFLNGKLIEDVYMSQLEGFVHSKYPDRVCILRNPFMD